MRFDTGRWNWSSLSNRIWTCSHMSWYRMNHTGHLLCRGARDCGSCAAAPSAQSLPQPDPARVLAQIDDRCSTWLHICIAAHAHMNEYCVHTSYWWIFLHTYSHEAAHTACSNNMFVLCTSRQFCVYSRYVSWTTDTKVLRQNNLV